MLKVILKINSLSLRLREEAKIELHIKRQNITIFYPKSAQLKNGMANFCDEFQFLIERTKPIFQINVVIIYQGVKKFGGMCRLNLKQWDEGILHQTQYNLENSPDSKAAIFFDFLYLKSNITSSFRKLMSCRQYEEQQKSEKLMKIQLQNNNLTAANNQLHTSIQSLLRSNLALEMQNNAMKSNHQKNCIYHAQQLSKKQQAISNSKLSLQSMSSQLQKIKNMINNSGQSELISEMNTIMDSDISLQQNQNNGKQFEEK